MLFRNKKKRTIHTCNNMGQSENNQVERSQVPPYRKKNMYCVVSILKNTRKYKPIYSDKNKISGFLGKQWQWKEMGREGRKERL